MKKSITIIALLLIAVTGIFVFSYQYRNQKIENQTSDISMSFRTTEKEEEAQAAESNGQKQLLVEDRKNDYQLYYDGKKVTIVHGENKREFESWSYSVKCETPKIFCRDYDGDGEKELLIKIVNGKQEKKDKDGKTKYTYALYMFKPVTQRTGEKTFSSIAASTDTWKVPFDEAIKCEMTQLKECKKFLQFTMDDIEEEISYNEKTGITDNEHVGYARALADVKNKYYTLKSWNKGAGIYNLNEKNGDITLDIQVLANYEETADTQYIGDIHCNMNILNGSFTIVPKTIVFRANADYKVNDPRDSAKSKWSCEISNASKNTNFVSTDIDWIETELSLSNTASKNTQYFETLPSKIKCVDTVKFTQSSVVFTAKKGYTFSKNMADAGIFSVLFNYGEKNEMNIAYTCSVKYDKNGSTLTINFDKTYDKEDFDKVFIKFGV